MRTKDSFMRPPNPAIYSVQEAAERTGLTTYTLRYYEREGLLAPIPRATSSGHRRYSEEDLRLLHFLKRMRETGMPIRQMKRYVALILAGDSTLEERRQMLIAHRDMVRKDIAKLQTHLTAIEEKIDSYAALSREYEDDAARLQQREDLK